MKDFTHLAKRTFQELKPYQPGKPIAELKRELGLSDIIKLASNENPYGCSDKVISALTDLDQECHLYPDGASYELTQALATFWDVASDDIVITNGSDSLLLLLCRCFLNPNEVSIASQYSFASYQIHTKAVGGNIILTNAKDYGVDLDAMLSAITKDTKLIFIANPNNPTGTWIDHNSLAKFLEEVMPHILVVIDEAYYEYIEEPSFPNSLQLRRSHPNLIITRTFSKAYGLAGLRLGYGIMHPSIAAILNRARLPFEVNRAAQILGKIALTDQAFVKHCVRENNHCRQYLTDGLTALNLQFIPSLGNFICVDFAQDALAIYQALLQEGIITRPLGGYQMPTHLRISIGTKAECERLLVGLKKVLSL